MGATQKYTIRDLNTGQMFALNPISDPNSPEAAAHPITDFVSGKQLSLEEFDLALGLGGHQSVNACPSTPPYSLASGPAIESG